MREKQFLSREFHMRNVSLLVLTGGTVAGKSSVLSLLSDELSDQAVFIEETGTKVLARPEFLPPNGRRDGEEWEEWQLGLQKQIFKEQRQAEFDALEKARREGKRLVVTDRGTPDCWIWLSSVAAKRFERDIGATIDAEFCRYSLAVYLPSLSVIDKDLYLQHRRNNPSRLPRSLESAQEVEAKTRTIWSGCARVALIRGDLSFEEKFQDIRHICSRFLQTSSCKPAAFYVRKLEC